MRFAFRIQKKSRCTMKFSQGHWTFLGLEDEMKWYGTLLHTREGKWNSTATDHSVFKSFSALSLGILKKKTGRDTSLQCGYFQQRHLTLQ